MLGGRKVRLAGMSASIMRGLEVDPVRGHLLALQAARIDWGLKCGLTGEWQGSAARRCSPLGCNKPSLAGSLVRIKLAGACRYAANRRRSACGGG